jgi:hypothetical protein
MYSQQPDLVTVIGEEEGQDYTLKSFPLPTLSGLMQSLDSNILTSVGVVVWAPSVAFPRRFPGGGERTREC